MKLWDTSLCLQTQKLRYVLFNLEIITKDWFAIFRSFRRRAYKVRQYLLVYFIVWNMQIKWKYACFWCWYCKFIWRNWSTPIINKHFLSDKARFKKFEPFKDCIATYPIQTVQPLYRFTESFTDALLDIEAYGRTIMKPITTVYN